MKKENFANSVKVILYIASLYIGAYVLMYTLVYGVAAGAVSIVDKVKSFIHRESNPLSSGSMDVIKIKTPKNDEKNEDN